MSVRYKKSNKLYQERLKKYAYLENNISREITIRDPILNKKIKFIFEGYKIGEPILIVRYPGTRLFNLYHIDYLVMEE